MMLCVVTNTSVTKPQSVMSKIETILGYLYIKGTGSPYKITECRVPELIPVLGSQPTADVSHKPGGRLSLLSARPAW